MKKNIFIKNTSGYKYLYYNLKNLNEYVDTNNKTEYFIYIVTVLTIVRSKSQTSIHIIGYPYFILRIMTDQYKIKR